MIQLRDYQETVYQDTIKAINKGSKGILIQLPCRSGKSYVMAKFVETCKGNSLILAHRNELLSQHKELIDSLGLLNKCRLASVFTEVNHLGEHEKPMVILIDECHLSEASSYKKIADFYGCIIIGFSATPTRLNGDKLTLYDTLINGVSVKYLIKQGAIADFEYYAPDIALDLTDIDTLGGDYNGKQLNDLMFNSAIYGDVIDSYKKLGDGRQAIAYCAGVNHSKKVCEEFNSAGIKAVHIDGSMNKTERKKIMDLYRSGYYTVLCNANIISEGITLPNASIGLLLRPTQSLALYIQQSMRVLTPDGNGKKAVIIDCVGNYQRHGLPDENREWTLEGVKRKHKTNNDDGSFTIRNCPNCFRIFKTANKCPYCGHEFEVKGRELQCMEEVRLRKISEQEKIAIAEHKRKQRMEVGMAKTKEDLIKIAKERGYKPGWIFVTAKRKGIKL